MPSLLLPNTASPFAARAPPTVVLKTKPDPWLTATLKRINRIKRPLNSVPQHTRCLTDTLSQPTSVWTLCTLLVPRMVNPQNITDYEVLPVMAYVVHVDLVLAHEIAFKLTTETINALTAHHNDIWLPGQRAATWQWQEKDAAVKKLHADFIQAVNKFVYRTDAVALEGLEDDGAGELLCGRANDVKGLINGLFAPLMPPPPPPVQRPSPQSQWAYHHPPPPVEAWKILPSSPVEDVVAQNNVIQHTTAESFPSIWAETTQAVTTAPLMPPLPSLVAQQCSMGSGFAGFGWPDRYQDYATTI